MSSLSRCDFSHLRTLINLLTWSQPNRKTENAKTNAMEYLDYLVLKNCIRLIDIMKTMRLEPVSHNFASAVQSVVSTTRVSLEEDHISLYLLKGKTILFYKVIHQDSDLTSIHQILSRFKHLRSAILNRCNPTVLKLIISTLSTERCKRAAICCLSLYVPNRISSENEQHYWEVIDRLSFSLREIQLFFYMDCTVIDGIKTSTQIFTALLKCKKLKKLSFDQLRIDELECFSKIYEVNESLRHLSIRKISDFEGFLSFLATPKCLRIIEQLRSLNIGVLYYPCITGLHQKEIATIMGVLQKNARLESMVRLSMNPEGDAMLKALNFFLIPAMQTKRIVTVKLDLFYATHIHKDIAIPIKEAITNLERQHGVNRFQAVVQALDRGNGLAQLTLSIK